MGELRSYGVTGSIAEDKLSIDYKVTTDSGALQAGDLPLATGGETPPVFTRAPGAAEIVAGLRGPGQVVTFTEAALKATDPSSSAQYVAGKERAGKQLGVDIDADLIDQLTGSSQVVVNIDGPPVLAPIPGTELAYVLNTNWDLLRDGTTYYLRHERGWLTAPAPAGNGVSHPSWPIDGGCYIFAS